MKQRNNSVDAIKGIAILLVMFGHVFVHNHMEDPYGPHDKDGAERGLLPL